jgi:hypothetical protein
MQETLALGGWFTIEVYDKNGNLKSKDRSRNGITTQGLNWILNNAMHNSSAAYAISTWYCALASTNTAFASTMTYAVPSFTEFTLYDESTRPAYTENTASTVGCQTSNSDSKAAFTISATVTTPTIYGAALMAGSVKGDTATTGLGATLLCYSLLSTSRAVVASDVINLTYQIGAS